MSAGQRRTPGARAGESLDRRGFLEKAARLAAGACGAGALAGCGGLRYVSAHPAPNGWLAVPLAAFAEDDGVLVRVPGDARPVYLRRVGDETYLALTTRCTHRGCQVEPLRERLACPCHGSEFDLEGRVLGGPADRPLPRYRTRVEAGRVLVDTTAEAGR